MAQSLEGPNAALEARVVPTTVAPKLLSSLRRIVQALDLESRELVRLTGLRTAQLVLLMAIRELGEVTSSRLAHEASLSQATVTEVLDRLEAKGLIVRYRSDSDRRIVHARLTDAGRLALRRAPRQSHRRFLANLQRLPQERQLSLLDACLQLEHLLLDDPPARQDGLLAAKS